MKTKLRQEMKQVEILELENKYIKVAIAPGLGGRLTSIYNKQLNKEFLWHNESLELKINQPGDDYDTNFWGGVDELLPNDIPETVDGIAYPDHGELWTARLDYTSSNNWMSVYGILPASGLWYQKNISLEADAPVIRLEYNIINKSGTARNFLWKLHAALRIAKGDRLLTSAKKAKVVYGESSRFKELNEFSWPMIEGIDAATVPEKNGSMDFFYLYDAPAGSMSLLSENGQHRFAYDYDPAVFPYQWYFASYGQFRDHYTAILEPATAMPVSVNEAAALNQCSILQPGMEINTEVRIYAGANESYPF